jgi:hypothetical protein
MLVFWEIEKWRQRSGPKFQWGDGWGLWRDPHPWPTSLWTNHVFCSCWRGSVTVLGQVKMWKKNEGKWKYEMKVCTPNGFYRCLKFAHWWLACSWWWLWPDSWETPSGKYDEHSGKSFPSVRNQGLSVRRRADNTTEGDACKLRDSSGQFIWRLVQALLCEQQRGICTQHNQILCSQLAMRLSISPVCLKQRVWAYRVENSRSIWVK